MKKLRLSLLFLLLIVAILLLWGGNALALNCDHSGNGYNKTWVGTTGKCGCGYECTHSANTAAHCTASAPCSVCTKTLDATGHSWPTQNCQVDEVCEHAGCAVKRSEVMPLKPAHRFTHWSTYSVCSEWVAVATKVDGNCIIANCGAVSCYHDGQAHDGFQSGTWVNGVCSLCKAICTHDGVRNNNGFKSGTWSSGECSACKAKCIHQTGGTVDAGWSNGACKACGVKCEHADPINGVDAWDSATGTCKACGVKCIHQDYGTVSDWDSATGKCKACGMLCFHLGATGGPDCTVSSFTCNTCGMAFSFATHTWQLYPECIFDPKCSNRGCRVRRSEIYPNENYSQHNWVFDSTEGCYTCINVYHNGGNNNCRCATVCYHDGSYHISLVDSDIRVRSGSFVKGVCSTCNYNCDHTGDGNNRTWIGTTGKCGCGYECPHSTNPSDWTYDETAGKCNACKKTHTHGSWTLDAADSSKHICGVEDSCPYKAAHSWIANGATGHKCSVSTCNATAAHDWSNNDGKCATLGCGYLCPHNTSDGWTNNETTGKCNNCGKSHTHGSWTLDAADSSKHICGAETGCPYKKDHEWASNGATGHKCSETTCTATANHDWSNNDGTCKAAGCGYTCPHSVDAGEWTLTNTTGICPDCKKSHTHGNWKKISDKNNVSHGCGAENNCPFTTAHSWQRDANDSTKHTCSELGCAFTESHDWKQIGGITTQHKCSKCPVMADHSWARVDDNSHKCKDCNMIVSHSYASNGDATHTCSTCNDTVSHVWELLVNNGELHKCVYCTETTAHTWNKDGVCTEARCRYICKHNTAKGWTQTEDTGTCNTCKKPHTHDDAGNNGVCKICSYIACDHSVPRINLRWKTEPTCLTDGVYIQQCSKCKSEIELPVRALGHLAVTTPSVEPTCGEPGKTEGKHCDLCGFVMVPQKDIPALAHTPEIDPAVAASCSNAGLTEGSHCSTCGKIIKKQNPVPALAHTLRKDAAVEPTCTEPGLTAGYHCSVCGEIIEAQKPVSARSHNMHGSFDPKTLSLVFRCADCGLSYQGSFAPIFD